MKRIEVGLVLITSLISNVIYGQDVEGLLKEKPVTISGNLSVRTLFYEANGIENRREPFSYVITGSPTLNLYGLSIPISFIFSEQERSFRQPFNQFGASPRYKWITVHAGYRNLNYSPYTLAGHTILGAGIELNPGIFRFGFMYGRLKRATPVDTTSFSLQPFNYNRYGYAVKAGLGKQANHFEFSLLKAKDDTSKQAEHFNGPNRIFPAENVVIGLKTKVTFLKKISWETNSAVSFYTYNIHTSVSIDSSEIPDIIRNSVGKIMEINGSTEHYTAFQTSLGYLDKKFSLRLNYRRIDPQFQSMGSYFFNNDIESYTIAPSLNLFKQKVRFSGSLGIQHDNLNNKKLATNTRIIGSALLSAEITKSLGLDVNYTNFASSQRARTVMIADSFLIAQTTGNISITPRYIIQGNSMNHIILLSFNRMTLNDNNSNINNNIESNHAFLNYQISFIKRGMNLSFNLNTIKLRFESGEDSNAGASIGVTKRTLNNKLLLGISSSVMRGNRLGGNSMIYNNGLKIDYKVGEAHSFNLILHHINNQAGKSNTEFSNNKSYSELRGEIAYNLSF